ncbi:hypothetical protein JYG30_04055 [Fibrella sp. USSR17]
MQQRHSIEAIHKVIMTNDRPVLVSCDDFNDYLCKYKHPERQFNELLAWGFLKEWGIPVPDACLVNIKPEHISDEALRAGARHAFFERPVFGSLYSQYSREVDNSLTALRNSPKDIHKVKNRIDLLRIALFDLWMTNEDRNGNNYNLLLVPVEPSKLFIHAIDQAACFNSGNAGQYPLSPLTEDDSVLSTDFCQTLYANSPAFEDDSQIVLAEFRQKIGLCNKSLPKILTFVPSSWGINIVERQRWLLENLFDDSWLRQTEEQFREYIQRFAR